MEFFELTDLSDCNWGSFQPEDSGDSFDSDSSSDSEMGGNQSVEVPGGGTEGYHVLRVSL